MTTRKKPYYPAILVGLAMLAGVAGCTKIPAPDLAIGTEVERASYPALLPEDALPKDTAFDFNSAAVVANLEARAAALRARAAVLLLSAP
ncbi:MAG: hypothetical protein KDE11_03110 [Rhodobacteraceae bacterium]|nr:hypothetical protein [Paracoccaceae bacterium]